MIAWLLVCILHLTPHGAPARFAIAQAISDVVEENGAIFAGEDGKRKTAGLMLFIAFRESSFRLGARGDKDGVSVCWFQIMGGDKSLLTDGRACALEGYKRLRESVKACPSHPLAGYAQGNCTGLAGQRISNDRMRGARGLLGVVVP